MPNKCEMYLNLEVKSRGVGTHWAHRHLANKANEKKIRWNWLALPDKPKAPCTVTLERIYNYHANGRAMDDDNYIAVMKGIRDTVADLILPGLNPGQADHDSRGIKFIYLQTRGEIARVRITIQETP